MGSENSNNQPYILPSSRSESMRLESQGALLYGSTEFLKTFLSSTPIQILDVGCGTGYFARFVAEELKESQVVGVDQDEQRIEFAKNNNPYLNLDFQNGSVYELPFSSNSFDLVYCRFVLVHVGELAKALKEMQRVCKVGGRVVAFEMLHDRIYTSPPKPALSQVLQQVVLSMRERNLEPDQALFLASQMVKIGLSHVQAQVIPHSCLGHETIYDAYRQNWIDTLKNIKEVVLGKIDALTFQKAIAELGEKRLEDFFMELTLLASGTKI